MNAERREQVEAVCAEALEREGDERARFLEDACRGDGELRRLVDWLLPETLRVRVAAKDVTKRLPMPRMTWT